MARHSSDNEFLEYIREALEPFDIGSIKPMFGGFGVYKSGVIFALISDNELYFKADKPAAEFFTSFGSEPFAYENKGRIIKMSYWKVLPEILEDYSKLEAWCDEAHRAALTAKKPKNK